MEASLPLTIVGWTFSGLLLVMVVICIAAASGRLPLNGFVGIRIPSLMRDDGAWRAGHTAAVRPAAVALVVALVASGIGPALPPAHWGAIAAFVAGVVWVFVSASRAVRLAVTV